MISGFYRINFLQCKILRNYFSFHTQDQTRINVLSFKSKFNKYAFEKYKLPDSQRASLCLFKKNITEKSIPILNAGIVADRVNSITNPTQRFLHRFLNIRCLTYDYLLRHIYFISFLVAHLDNDEFQVNTCYPSLLIAMDEWVIERAVF